MVAVVGPDWRVRLSSGGEEGDGANGDTVV